MNTGGYDVAIVGGGIMGSATAYYLRRLDPERSVVVLEMDPTYEHCSTLRSDGNLRVQFSLRENIEMSLYTFELIATLGEELAVGTWKPDPAPRFQGNLFLTDEAGEAAARQGLELQQSLGCEVEWLDADVIASRWPAYRANGVVGGTFGPRDGSVDPNAMLYGYRRKAAELEAVFMPARVERVMASNGRVSGVATSDGRTVEAPIVVNCAGGWATELAATVGVGLPVTPTMRTVYTVDTEIDTAGLPSVFTPSAAYAIPEAGRSFAVAWSQETDPVGFDFSFSRSGFEDTVWPELAKTLPAFEALRVTGGWTGLYAVNSLDGNAILGEWPHLEGFYLANGFSGHGFQHGPAVGRHLAELILGVQPSLDLTRFGPQRVLDGKPVFEHAGRII